MRRCLVCLTFAFMREYRFPSFSFRVARYDCFTLQRTAGSKPGNGNTLLMLLFSSSRCSNNPKIRELKKRTREILKRLKV